MDIEQGKTFEQVTAMPDPTVINRDREQIAKLGLADIEDHAHYGALRDVLDLAFMQAERGKGHDRHSQGKPFLEQPILEIPRMQGSIDGLTYQIMKKAQEAGRMLSRGQYSPAVAELYGVINYAAAAVIRVREIETERGEPDDDNTL